MSVKRKITLLTIPFRCSAPALRSPDRFFGCCFVQNKDPFLTRLQLGRFGPGNLSTPGKSHRDLFTRGAALLHTLDINNSLVPTCRVFANMRRRTRLGPLFAGAFLSTAGGSFLRQSDADYSSPNDDISVGKMFSKIAILFALNRFAFACKRSGDGLPGLCVAN